MGEGDAISVVDLLEMGQGLLITLASLGVIALSAIYAA